MDSDMMSALEAAGVDAQDGLKRFAGNGELYEKFLHKFLDDDNYAKIAPALEAEDWAAAQAAAHTVKGVSGNLGMKIVFKESSALVTALQDKQYTEAMMIYTKLAQAYRQVVEILQV